jgi:hypothetical protein
LIYTKGVSCLLQRFRSSENPPDVFFLNVRQAYGVSQLESGFSFNHFARKMFNTNTIGFAEDGSALYDITQFSHISRPIIFFQRLDSLVCEPQKSATILAAEKHKEPFSQEGHVFESFPEGRNLNLDNI